MTTELTDEQLREALRQCPHDAVEALRVRWLYAKDFARAVIAADRAQRQAEQEPVAIVARSCVDCHGTGVDGDCGPDGQTIDVPCGSCKGTGTQPTDGIYRGKCANGDRCLHGCHRSESCHYLAKATPDAAPDGDTARLDWLEANTGMETSCTWDEDAPWVVHRVTGGRNDREWTKMGRGETLREAIDAAIRQASAR